MNGRQYALMKLITRVSPTELKIEFATPREQSPDWRLLAERKTRREGRLFHVRSTTHGEDRKLEAAWQIALREVGDVDTMAALIQALIPPGLQAGRPFPSGGDDVGRSARYARTDGAPHLVRSGRQGGSI